MLAALTCSSLAFYGYLGCLLDMCCCLFLAYVLVVGAMDGPPAIRRRRRATNGVPLLPLPRASRRKGSCSLVLGYGYISSGRPKRKCTALLFIFPWSHVVMLPYSCVCFCALFVIAIDDGFFPVLSSEVTSANRKKRKLIHDRWLGRIPGAYLVPLIFSVSLDLPYIGSTV